MLIAPSTILRSIGAGAFLAGGSSDETIAREPSIGARTAGRHIANVYLKVGAHNRAEATAYVTTANHRGYAEHPSGRPRTLV